MKFGHYPFDFHGWRESPVARSWSPAQHSGVPMRASQQRENERDRSRGQARALTYLGTDQERRFLAASRCPHHIDIAR